MGGGLRRPPTALQAGGQGTARSDQERRSGPLRESAAGRLPPEGSRAPDAGLHHQPLQPVAYHGWEMATRRSPASAGLFAMGVSDDNSAVGATSTSSGRRGQWRGRRWPSPPSSGLPGHSRHRCAALPAGDPEAKGWSSEPIEYFETSFLGVCLEGPSRPHRPAEEPGQRGPLDAGPAPASFRLRPAPEAPLPR